VRSSPAPSGTVSTLDQLEIQELVSVYNRTIDRGDVEGWLACFTPDGAFQGIAGRFEGEAARRSFASDLTNSPSWAGYRPMRHWTTNFLISYDGGPDAARMRADHLLVRPTREGVKLLVMAVYRDRLRRVDGRWLFAERIVEVQGGLPS